MGLFGGPVRSALEQFIKIINIGNDFGLRFIGDPSKNLTAFELGEFDEGVSLSSGHGSSYPVDTAYHCTLANTSYLTITNAVDVTSALQSETGSTTGLFNGTVLGNYILLGSDHKFEGLEVKTSTGGIVEAANFAALYIKNSVPTIPLFYLMSTDFEHPLTQNGKIIAANNDSVENWRFGFDYDSAEDEITWDKVTYNINGQNVTKYWIWILLVGAITSDPVIEYIKLHTDSMKVGKRGEKEYFGKSRQAGSVDVIKRDNTLTTPAAYDIPISTTMTAKAVNNRFDDNNNDSFLVTGEIPPNLDTSIPLKFIVDFIPLTAVAGNVDFDCQFQNITPGFVHDGSAVSTPLVGNTVSVVGTDQDKRIRMSFNIPIQDSLPGDTFVLNLSRDATAGNTSDTYVGDVAISPDVKVNGFFWR